MPLFAACVALLAAATLLSNCASRPIEIVGRESWGAREPRSDISRYSDYGLAVPEYTTIVLHITSMGRGSGEGEIRRVQDFHLDVRGFSDIGYNFLIDSAGAVFEGRSLAFVPSHAGRAIEADAAHDITLDPDYRAIGIAFSAEHDEDLTTSQVVAGIALIEELQRRHPVATIITHTEVRQRLLARGLTPYNEFDPAQCPGVGSIEGMISIRREVDPGFDPAAYARLFR